MIQIQIADQKLEYFKRVSEIDSEVYDSIRAHFRTLSKKLLTIEEFTAEIRAYVGQSKAIALSTTLISLRRLKDRYECSTSEILDGITTLLREKGYLPEVVEQWQSKKEELMDLVDADSTGITENASDLYYRHINYCHDFKVITESRPIFDSGNSSLVGYVTVNNMYLVFSKGNRRETTLSIALGLEQIKGLVRELNKAISQTELYKQLCEKDDKLNRVFDSKW